MCLAGDRMLLGEEEGDSDFGTNPITGFLREGGFRRGSCGVGT